MQFVTIGPMSTHLTILQLYVLVSTFIKSASILGLCGEARTNLVLFHAASVCPCPPWFANATIQGSYNWSSTAPPDCKYDDSVRYYGTTIDYECPYGYVFEYNGEQNLELKCETWADWHPAGPLNCIRKLHQLFHVFFLFI